MLLILLIVTWYEEESQQYWTYVVNMLLCGIIISIYSKKAMRLYVPDL